MLIQKAVNKTRKSSHISIWTRKSSTSTSSSGQLSAASTKTHHDENAFHTHLLYPSINDFLDKSRNKFSNFDKSSFNNSSLIPVSPTKSPNYFDNTLSLHEDRNSDAFLEHSTNELKLSSRYEKASSSKRSKSLRVLNKIQPVTKTNQDNAMLSIPQPNGRRTSVPHHSEPSSPLIPSVSMVKRSKDWLAQAVHYLDQGDMALAYENICLAASNGISPMAYFLKGILKRQGWGTKQDMPLSLKYMERAAALCTKMIRKVKESNHPNDNKHNNDCNDKYQDMLEIAKQELRLIAFELAQSYQYGWGTLNPKKSKTRKFAPDHTTAVYYLTISAQLGDSDACRELSDVYLKGKSVKKDKYKAAYWMRKAHKDQEGENSRFGESWAWKKKYDKTVSMQLTEQNSLTNLT